MWQTNGTHFSQFGRLTYVHLMIDNFSTCIFASTHTGERVKDGWCHFLSAFAALGVPVSSKTDNGPACTSKQMDNFFHLWGCAVSLVFHIPLKSSDC